MSAIKRKSISTVSSAAKRTAAKAGLHDIQVLVDALNRDSWMGDSLPAVVREMLAAAAPHALAPLAEDRLPVQNKMVDGIREALESALNHMYKRAEAMDRNLTDKEPVLEVAKAKLVAAGNAADSARSAAQAQKTKLDEVSGRVKGLEKDIKTVQAAKKECGKERAAHMKMKERLQALIEQGLQPLVDNALADKDAKRVCAKFMRDVEKLVGSVTPSVSAVLLQKKQERQEFDVVVIEHVREMITEKIAVLDADLEANQAQAHALEADLEVKDIAVQELRAEEAQEATKYQGEHALLEAATKVVRLESAGAESVRSQMNDLVAATQGFEGEVAKLVAVKKSFEEMASRSREEEQEMVCTKDQAM